MCGIAGILRFDGAPVTKTAVEKILNKLAHRGRDHWDIVLGSQYNADHAQITKAADIGFGHRRLSIIDLDVASAQPMFYAQNNLCITYNGEIYNYLELKQQLQKNSYVFTTNSDTEVLLAAYDFWGKECVKHLNGMFAFALWDERNQYLFCARDAVGIKPFYYTLSAKLFAFASESLALLDQQSLNLSGVISYFLSMYVATSESIFSDIKKLPPGHTLIVKLDGSIIIERFWSIEQFDDLPASELHRENLAQVIQQAITRQLQSDVPIGGFLSGGIDSGLITALAAPQLKKYYTYSVGYEGLLNNELAQANLLAQRYGTQHTAVTITAANAMTTLNNALNNISEPIADPAIVATYFLAELAAKDGVKVLLNGTGGDEIFGGYTRYSGQLSLKRKLLGIVPAGLKKLAHYFPVNHKIKSRLRYPGLDMMYSTGGSYSLARQFTNHDSYFTNFLATLGNEFDTLNRTDIPMLYQQMLFDMQVYLPDQLLYLLDQMTMAHTIEGRVPLLDTNVIKFAFNFQAQEHMRGGQTKAILKKVAEPYLGLAHTQRKKQGFAGSSSWWVKHNYAEFIDVIAELKHIPYFDKFNIDTFLARDRDSEKHTNDVFILYCFGKWYDRINGLMKAV
jgi:asparagine synthase (glutamine-hydrolysing)